MDGSVATPQVTNTSMTSTASQSQTNNTTEISNDSCTTLPKQLEDIPVAMEFPKVRHRWNTNEEIASILIAFDKHKEWQQRELKVRPPTGSMLLFNRNQVRYRKDGYCWKRRKDGKTIREDHMKLKVQGVECIYGSYVHSAILNTFHRRCYWLLQNPDIVLVHYLNVPYPNNTKLSLPTLSFAKEKKEWTKEEMMEQLQPMFTSEHQEATKQNQVEEMISALLQQLIENPDSKRTSGGSCSSDYDKVCPHSKCVKVPQHHYSTSQIKQDGSQPAITCNLLSILQQGCQNGNGPVGQNNQTLPQGSNSNLLVLQSSEQAGPVGDLRQTPLMLNIGSISNYDQFIPISGQMTTAQVSVLTKTLSLAQLSSCSNSSNTQLVGCHQVTSQIVTGHPIFSTSDVKLDSSMHNTPNFKDDGSHVQIQPACTSTHFNGVNMASAVTSIPVSMPHLCNGNPGIIPIVDNTGHRSACNISLQDFTDLSENIPTSSGTSFQMNPMSAVNCDETDIASDSLQNICSLEDSLEGLHASLSPSDLNLDNLCSLELPDIEKICGDLNTENSNVNTDQDGSQHVLSNSNKMGNIVFSNCNSMDNIPTVTQSHSDRGQISCHQSAVSQGISPVSMGDQRCCPAGRATLTSVGNMSSPSYQCNTDSSPHQIKSVNNIAVITDFTPDWSYTEGQTKILVTGPWYSTSSTYSVLLDGKVVGCTLVQPGVLRCFVPAHEPGLVTLQIACDGSVISNMVAFEYKENPKITNITDMAASERKDWFSISDDQLRNLLIRKIELIEKALILSGPKLMFAENYESCKDTVLLQDLIFNHIQCIRKAPWAKHESFSRKLDSMGLTLLHLAAGFGFQRLVNALVQWRSESPSWHLEHEVDAQRLDNNGCTPFMWACAKGHFEAAVSLYHWNKAATSVYNRDGFLPLTVARQHGYHDLANHIENLQSSCSISSSVFSGEGMLNTTREFSSLSSLSISPGKPGNVKASVTTPVSEINFSNQFKPPEVACSSKENSLGNPEINSPTAQTNMREKIVRRQSEQSIKGRANRAKLKKRLSMDLLPSDLEPTSYSTTSDFQRPIREANSEPHLVMNLEHLTRESNPMLSDHNRDLSSPDMLMQMDMSPNLDKLGLEGITQLSQDVVTFAGSLLIQMETSDDLSDRSGSPFIDVEKVTSDEEDVQSCQKCKSLDWQSTNCEGTDEAKHQMVTLAKQIIAAMPAHIKSSPSEPENQTLRQERERSSSYSSVPSQPSPHASSYGEDSGISTPMRDGLAFDEYRYPDLGTPASSLSPDSTCLHSPYSPYSFQLDSPPPTTAEFTEYFNAPATFMEKDFSQLTLSDQEQRKLYEAAKVIQSAYRMYRNKQHQQQRQNKEIEAAILIQSYYRRYKQYAYYKKMTQAAVLIQSQFRSYYAQKRFKKSRDAAVVIQNQYRSYKEHERLKKGGNKSVTQRYRSHYQRKLAGSAEGSSRMVQIIPDTPEGDLWNFLHVHRVPNRCKHHTHRRMSPRH
ncbi:hypothetical protein CHS0354_019074 [Potamilus streckersoni]|uniref:CG-1 domain-containing protein n=1 Tax=Potamilus streckersoni TaxID=2493646 RepID=A0AAE0T6D5_9BIVA|nr:hypothetical protein CHS0354_019074 [Potamilus streckersoni]